MIPGTSNMEYFISLEQGSTRLVRQFDSYVTEVADLIKKFLVKVEDNCFLLFPLFVILQLPFHTTYPSVRSRGISMDHIYEHGYNWRTSPDLWSEERRGLLRRQYRTEHGQRTIKRRNTQLTHVVQKFPTTEKSQGRAGNRTRDLLISRQQRCHRAKWPDQLFFFSSKLVRIR